jgi:nitrate reductase beta subunit
MRKKDVLGEIDESLAPSVGLGAGDLERMYRLLAIAKYEDRYVIPQAHAELGQRLLEQQGGACSVGHQPAFNKEFMLPVIQPGEGAG